MDEMEQGVLEACQEVVHRQQEMLPLLASAIQAPEEEVFYTWATRKCKQQGDLAGAEWWYFFHGLECDLRNKVDGRFLRIDFGPGGRVDTFTAWGVLQFIMTSVSPWTDYLYLKTYFADRSPPYNEFSGSAKRMGQVWDRLENQGFFEKAAPDLLEFEARYTTLGPDGIARVCFPQGTSEKMSIDCSVANRNLLSPQAVALLKQLVEPIIAGK